MCKFCHSKQIVTRWLRQNYARSFYCCSVNHEGKKYSMSCLLHDHGIFWVYLFTLSAESWENKSDTFTSLRNRINTSMTCQNKWTETVQVKRTRKSFKTVWLANFDETQVRTNIEKPNTAWNCRMPKTSKVKSWTEPKIKFVTFELFTRRQPR